MIDLLLLAKYSTVAFFTLVTLAITLEVFLDRRIKSKKESIGTAISLMIMWSTMMFMLYTTIFMILE